MKKTFQKLTVAVLLFVGGCVPAFAQERPLSAAQVRTIVDSFLTSECGGLCGNTNTSGVTSNFVYTVVSNYVYIYLGAGGGEITTNVVIECSDTNTLTILGSDVSFCSGVFGWDSSAPQYGSIWTNDGCSISLNPWTDSSYELYNAGVGFVADYYPAGELGDFTRGVWIGRGGTGQPLDVHVSFGGCVTNIVTTTNPITGSSLFVLALDGTATNLTMFGNTAVRGSLSVGIELAALSLRVTNVAIFNVSIHTNGTGFTLINGGSVTSSNFNGRNFIFREAYDDGVNLISATEGSVVSAVAASNGSNNVQVSSSVVDVNSSDDARTRIVGTSSKATVRSDGSATNELTINQDAVYVFNSGSTVRVNTGSGLSDVWIYATGNASVDALAVLSRLYVYAEEGARVLQFGFENDMAGNANGGTAIQDGSQNKLQFYAGAESTVYQGGELGWMAAQANDGAKITNTGSGNIINVQADAEKGSFFNSGSWSMLGGWGYSNANSGVMMWGWSPSNYVCAMSNQFTVRYGPTWFRVNEAGARLWGGGSAYTGSGSGLTNLGLTATADLSFSTLAVGLTDMQTVALTGAAVNDAVILGLPVPGEASQIFQAYVSEPDVVTILRTNAGEESVDLGERTYRVTIIK